MDSSKTKAKTKRGVEPTSGIAQLASQGWVSLRQFAFLINVSYPTALAIKKRGEVKVVPVGGINRVYAKEVERFLIEGNLPKR